MVHFSLNQKDKFSFTIKVDNKIWYDERQDEAVYIFTDRQEDRINQFIFSLTDKNIGWEKRTKSTSVKRKRISSTAAIRKSSEMIDR